MWCTAFLCKSLHVFVVVLFLSDQISLRHNRTFYLTFLIEDGDRKWTGKKVGEKYSWDLMIRARLMSQKCKDKMKGHVTLVAVLNKHGQK